MKKDYLNPSINFALLSDEDTLTASAEATTEVLIEDSIWTEGAAQ